MTGTRMDGKVSMGLLGGVSNIDGQTLRLAEECGLPIADELTAE